MVAPPDDRDGASRALSGDDEPERLKAELLEDLEAYASYVAEHGSPAEQLRRHLTKDSDAV